MKKSILLIISILLLALGEVYAQTYNVPATGNNTISTCSGTLYDPGGTGNYAVNQNGYTVISPSVAGNVIRIVGTSSAGEACCDYVRVYDGVGTAGTILGTYYMNTAIPTLTSTAGSLTVQFFSDVSVVGAGFSLTISCVPTPINMANSNSTITCGATTNFYDSGGAGGNYASSENMVKTISPSTAGQMVSAVFSAFTVETCCDKLYIFNGANTSAAQVAGSPFTASPGTVTAANGTGQLTFSWVSDGSVVYAGWAAALSCVAPPPVPACATYSAPANGATALNPALNTLTWSAVANATSYDIYFGTSASPAFFANTTATSYAITGFLPNTTYYWRIAPKNFVGAATGCATWSFTTGSAVSVVSGWTLNAYSCTGNLYDTGGAAGNYGNNENGTLTVYPATAGAKVQANFTAFTVETCCDNLKIYNGNSTAAPLIGTYTASPGLITSSATDGSLTFNFTSDGSVVYAGFAANLACCNANGNPATFGSNAWNVYGYLGNNQTLSANTYAGYYTENSLSYNTADRWGTTLAPSNATATGTNGANGTAWQGCVVPVDYHTVVAKRQGFPCGMYQLDVPTHDDDIQVFVNGALVFQHIAGCCDAHTNVWTGLLTTTSTVEVRHFEGVGGSQQQLTLTNVTNTSPRSNIGLTASGTSSCATPSNGTANIALTGGLTGVKRIRVTQKKADWLNLAELQAIQILTGTNLALASNGATATQSSAFGNDIPNYGGAKLIDNNTGTLFHSNSATVGEYAEITLANPSNLDHIIIYNRGDCCYDRSNQLELTLYDASGNVLYNNIIDAYQNTNSAGPWTWDVMSGSWSNSATTLNQTAVAPGTYTFTYSDALCRSSNAAYTVASIPVPTNDICSGTVPLVTAGTTAFNTICSSGTDITSCTFNDIYDVWYRYTAPRTGVAEFSTCGTAWDTGLSLWSACGGTELACNDDAAAGACSGTVQSYISYNVTCGTTYYIRVAGWNGAFGTGNLNVVDPPAYVAPTSASSNINPLCTNTGGNINLTAVGGSGVAIKWYSGSCGGTLVGTGNPLTIAAPTTTTTYYARYEDGCGGNTTCASVLVTVNAQPQVSSFASAAGVTSICTGSQGQLVVTTSSGTGPFTVVYNDGTSNQTATGVVSGTAFNAVPNPTTGTTTYTLVSITDANGCVRTTGFTDGTASISVRQLPTATISGTITVCQNASSPNITFSGTAPGGTIPPYTFTYNINGGATQTVTSTTSSVTVAVPTTATGTFTYNLLSVAFASNPACTNAASGSATVTVNALDWGNLQAPATATICPSGSQSVYGQVYEPGVTPGAGQGAGIVAQIGYSTSNTNPNTWTNWAAATYNTAVTGSNDEYIGTLSGLSAGTYYYAFRYSLNGCANQYGGYSAGGGGFWDGATYVSGVLTVLPNHTLTLASGSTSQTVCENVAIGSITYTLGGGATGATVTGLPSGVSGVVAGTTLTISGTPTIGGVYNYTITTTGNACTTASLGGTITVNSLVDYANLQSPSSGAICPSGSFSAYGQVYEPGVTPAAGVGAGLVAQIGYSTSNTNPNTWTNWSAATFNTQVGNNDEFIGTLSGLAAGTYYYTFRYSLNGCAYQYGGFPNGFWNGTTQNSGVLTVNPNHTISLSSGSNTQTLCQSTAITNIVYAVGGGATGAGVTGLPSGVTGNFSGGNFTISGSPTVAGTFSYTVTTTGNACTVATATGTITVNPSHTISLSSGSTTQTICAGAAIGNIVYAVGGGGTGAGVTGLPTGVTGNFSGGNFTISGTPSVTGTFSYTVTTTGNACTVATATGTITINPLHTISLSSGSTTQTVCENVAIGNIVYAVGGGATSASVSGLPSGVTGSFASGNFTISGTPTVGGTYNYTVTTSGNSCPAATATGTITVNSLVDYANLQSPSSGAICPSGSFSAYGQVYEPGVTPAAGVGAGLVAQIGYSTTNTNPNTWTNWSAATFNTQVGNNDEFIGTLSGLAAGTYYYTFRYSLNGCTYQYGGFPNGFWNGTTQNSGVLTVNPNHTISLSSGSNTQTLCQSTAITNIVYAVGGGATGAGVTGLPSGVTGNFSGGNFTISGSPSVSGTFSYTVTTTGNACTVATATGTITVNPNHTISLSSGSTTQTICPGAAIGNIVYAVGGGGTGAGVTGLPTGVTGNFSGGNFTISGTPSVTGTFSYTVTTTGNACTVATATGTITINPLHTISLSSGSATQTTCENATITNIVYAVGGGATSASVSGLPSGVTGSFASGNFTISGTPTVGGTYNYTVTTSGNSCPTVNATGTITVNSLIDYANLQFPSSGAICPSGSFTAYGQAYEPGVTPAAGVGAGLVAQIGYSTSNTNPNTWTNWSAATFNSQQGNNDEFVATLSGLAAGTYYYTFRYSLNGCAYQYGGFPNGFWNGTTQNSGVLTVNPAPTITLGAVTSFCQGASSFNLPYSATTASPNQYSISTGTPAVSGFSAITNASLGASPINIPIPTATTAGTYQFNMTVTNTTTTCVSTNQTFNITVNPRPTALTCKVDDTCQKSLGQITVNMSGGTTPYTITYSPSGTPASPISTSAASAVITGLTGGQTYNFTVLDANGCQAP